MKASLLRKWERVAAEERALRLAVRSIHPDMENAMRWRFQLATLQIALNRLERSIARAAYLEAFGVKPTVALVTRKRVRR